MLPSDDDDSLTNSVAECQDCKFVTDVHSNPANSPSSGADTCSNSDIIKDLPNKGADVPQEPFHTSQLVLHLTEGADSRELVLNRNHVGSFTLNQLALHAVLLPQALEIHVLRTTS
ncbi:hypothetical protein TNCV_2454681 [Trichonephila clavipes]|nr:hypothetical protein TNCV_2454681 [Trichonephila clavipes]